MRPVSKKRAALNRERAKTVAEMKRDQDWCDRCGLHVDTAGHERLARVHGGDITQPDDLLCNYCNGWAEDYPVQAAWDGWKVSGKHPRDPLLAVDEARDRYGNVVKKVA